jgi:hypothetical protein
MQPFPPQAWSSRFTALTQAMHELLTEFRIAYAPVFLQSLTGAEMFNGFLENPQATFIRDMLIMADFSVMMPNAPEGSAAMERYWVSVRGLAEACAQRRIQQEGITHPNEQHRVRVEMLANITQTIQQMRHGG